MHAAGHKPFVNRGLFAALCVLAILVAVSWITARARSTGRGPDLVADYFASNVHRTGGATDRLIDNLQRRLRATPDEWQSYGQLGLAYLQKARESGDPAYYPKAEGALRKALAGEPADYVAVSGLGALALSRHQFMAALTWGERALQINPNRPYAYGILADAQTELGRYQDAAGTLQKMVDLRPDLSSYSRISYIRELHGDAEGALEIMHRAVESGGPQAENTAWARTQLGNLYFNLGRFDEAEEEYRRTLETMPHYVYALAGLGRVRAAQGRSEEAIALLTQANEAAPLLESTIALGDLYTTLGREKEARQQYDLVGVMQQLYVANGVDLDLEMALFNADHGRDPAGTVAQARRALAQRPSIYAADALAWALYQSGEYAAAREYSLQALRLGTRDALMFYHAGMIAFHLGDRAQARDYLERALAINPRFSIRHAAAARSTLDLLVPHQGGG